MRLDAAKVIPFSAPLRRPVATARGRIEVREGFVLELRAGCGERGLGEASPAYWIDNRPLGETRAALERVAASVERYRDADEVRAAMLEDDGRARELTPAAACALDSALLDLAARAGCVPLCAILGGAAAAAPVPVCTLLASASVKELASEARERRRRGYTVFKLKVGAGTLEGDVDRVNALRDAIATIDLIRLDANRAWSFKEARSFLTKVGPGRIEYIEEPLQSASPVEFARLRGATGIAVALDESIESARGLESFREVCGPGLVLVLKAARVRGPSKCLEIATAARSLGVTKIVFTDSMESPVGMSVAIHLASALSVTGTAVGLGGAEFADRCGWDAATGMRDASWIAASGPGLGVSPRRSGL